MTAIAVAAILGALGGTFLLSWVAVLWIKGLVLAALLLLLLLLLAPGHRIAGASAYLITCGVVAAAGLMSLGANADGSTMLVAVGLVAVGVGTPAVWWGKRLASHVTARG